MKIQIFFLAFFLVFASSSQVISAADYDTNVGIPPGNEKAVLALFSPVTFQEEVLPGWTLENIAIFQQCIRLVLLGENSELEVTVSPLMPKGLEYSTPSFSVRSQDSLQINPDNQQVIEALSDLVASNDPGDWWAQFDGIPRQGNPIFIPEGDDANIKNQSMYGIFSSPVFLFILLSLIMLFPILFIKSSSDKPGVVDPQAKEK